MVRHKPAKVERREAFLIFLLITISGLVYYVSNNVYSAWAFSGGSNWLVLLFVYYFATQPIYVIFIWLMHEKWGPRGLTAAT